MTRDQCGKVKARGQRATAKLRTKAPVNVGRNYNGPKVAKFLVGQVPTCTKCRIPAEGRKDPMNLYCILVLDSGRSYVA